MTTSQQEQNHFLDISPEYQSEHDKLVKKIRASTNKMLKYQMKKIHKELANLSENMQ